MRAFVVGAVFLGGVVVGHYSQEKAPPASAAPTSQGPVDYSQDVYVYSALIAGDHGERYTPYCVSIDNKATHCGPLPPEEERWMVDLDGGRVRLYCVKVR